MGSLTEKEIIAKWVGIRKPPRNLTGLESNLFEREYEKKLGPVSLLQVNDLKFYSDSFLLKGNAQFSVNAHGKFNLERVPLRSLAKRKFLTEKSKTIKNAYLITDHFYKGYFHWWGDCIPKYWLLKEQIANRTLVLPSNLSKFHLDTLKLLKIENYEVLEENTYFNLNDVLICSNLAPTGNYHSATMKAIRQQILQDENLLKNKPPSRKLYVSRKNAPKRKLINEDAIESILGKHGFEIIHAENYSLKEQIEMMSETSVLMSVHGAGLTNMLFIPKGGKVIELRLAGDNHNNCYFSLASDLEHEYFYLRCQPNDASENQHTADLSLNTNQLEELLITMATVKT